ncbi:MAG: gliding motility-associated C-terminal domain-containing protein, partial [Prevotellaceae bacterium]|nr:gliding motility-associated C-terminal domain-containing protein [Prevotellaceae bacterium]
GFEETPAYAGNHVFVNSEKTVNGCDSITTLFLTVNQSYHDTINASICLNEYYEGYGFSITPFQRGTFTYVHDLTTSLNCDSITTLQLTVNPIYDEYVTARIYEDEFYRVGNYKYNTPGLHISNLQTAENCDSIINLHLDVIYYPPEITAFSPFNRDGVNDYFMSGFKIQIFNRYGALIYETITVEDLERGWDGRNSRKQNVEPGLYFYILYNSSGKPRIKSSVEVLKR